MPKIAGIGDLHIKRGDRLDDTLACLDFAIADAINQGVDVFLQAGDVFDATSTPEDRNAFAARVRKMAAHAPVVIVRGNHDKPGDLLIFGALETLHPVTVLERPGLVLAGGVRVYGFPHVDKGIATSLLPADMPIDEADGAMTALIRQVFDGWRRDILGSGDDCAPPAVFLGHLSVAGSQLSNGETLAHHGIQLSVTDLLDVGTDFTLVGHVHKAQSCDANGTIWYPGSIARANFGELRDPKGYLLIDIPHHGAEPRVEFRDVPARQMVALEATFDPIVLGDWDAPWSELAQQDLAGAEVRLRLTVPEDHGAEAETYATVARRALDGVAHRLQVEIRTTPVTRIRAAQIAEARTPEEKLDAYHAARGEDVSPELRASLHEKLKELTTCA